MNPLLVAALGYAERGWPVFPVHNPIRGGCSCNETNCARRAKHPRTKNGLKDAVTDPDQIKEWWRRWTDANIAIRTGQSCDALDLDGTGMDTFQHWALEHDVDLSVYPRAATGRGDGGRHLLIAPTGHGNRTDLLPHVDFRGQDGYIVAPPSLHISGNHYLWKQPPNGSIPVAHPAILALLAKEPRPAPQTSTASGGTPYGLRALADELRRLAQASDGQRNDTLNRVAFSLFQLVAGGELLENEVEVGLRTWARGIGLEDREIDRTIGSARKGGFEKPRSAPSPRTAAPVPPKTDRTTPPAISFAGMKVEHVTWLWPGHIPLGKVSLIDGMPGLGKSFLTVDLAARISSGRPMPDGTVGLGQPAGVLLLSAEDGLADTILPRLIAAGADLDYVFGHGDEDIPMIPDELGRIEEEIARHNIRFIVIDPLFAFVSAKARSISDQEMRQAAMTPLSGIAKRHGAAVQAVRHLSKDRDADPIMRGAGSMGIIGATRAAFLVGLNPDDESMRVLAPTKSNLAKEPMSLGFRLTSNPGDLVPHIEWTGVVALTARDLLAKPESDEARYALKEAKVFLDELLGNHALLSAREVEQQARTAGISVATLKRARAVMNIEVRKSLGKGSPWTWQIPWGPGSEPPDHF